MFLSHGMVPSALAAVSCGMITLKILRAAVSFKVSETQINALQLFKQTKTYQDSSYNTISDLPLAFSTKVETTGQTN